MTHLRAIRRPRLRCEVTRYVGRHGSDRVAKVVLLGAIPPLMLKTDARGPMTASRPSPRPT